MSELFKCLYSFENDQIYVLEIRRTDLALDSDKSELYRWLLFNKDSLEVTPLIFLSMDSNALSQERFFKQGYLSFDSEKAVFIHESSSEQHVLDVIPFNEVPDELNTVISIYLKKQKNSFGN